jgi:hypothetical protein
MTAESTHTVSKSRARSRVSNGKDWLPDTDHRSSIARRYRDIASAITVDQAGAGECSESRLQLIRRFAASAVMAEQMEAALVRGEQIDITQHALLCSTMVRISSRIGIDRRMKNLTPTLSDYLEQQAAE